MNKLNDNSGDAETPITLEIFNQLLDNPPKVYLQFFVKRRRWFTRSIYNQPIDITFTYNDDNETKHNRVYSQQIPRQLIKLDTHLLNYSET